MFKILAEQPILVSVLLGLLALALLYSWARGGGQRWLLVGGLLLLALIPAAWLTASLIVTDEEEIQLMIESFAANVEANRFDEAYEAIHPDREDILQRAQSELPRYEFSRARVGSYQAIRLLPNTQPQEAVVKLMAAVTVGLKGSGFEEQRAARLLYLRLQETPDGWRVIDYAHRNPVGPRDVYSSGTDDWEALLRGTSEER